MVDISGLANMFSEKTGAQSSIATMVINAVIGFMMQRGIGGMLSGGAQDGIRSALSNLTGGDNDMSQNNDLVKHIQQTCGIEDPQQASQYTQQAVSLMNEQGNASPQDLKSLFSNLMGGGQSQPRSSAPEQQQQQQQKQNDKQKKKGFLGEVMSGFGI